MLTNSEIKELTLALLDSRNKLLWLINQIPINTVQEKFIEDGRELLKKVNQYLEDFNYELPT